jgi:septum formation protein
LKQNRTIILASASPRRKELLEKIGLKFEVDPSDSNEILRLDIPPERMVKAISHEKALTVAQKYTDAIIIAADTLGIFNGKIITKPANRDEAKAMLLELSGKSHRVITGFTILDTASKKVTSHTVETKVYFKKLTEEEIDHYINSGEPLDKAGAYGIQGLGSVLIKKIAGDFYNVIGLPISALADNLKKFGVFVL